MNTNKKTPKLRFKGFTDDWEQRKLGDVAIITGGGTPSTNVPEYWNGDIDWYSPVEIGKNRYVSKSTRKITKLGLEKSSAKLLPIGTVLFTSRAGIGNTAILQAEGCTNQGFQSITPDSKELDTYFLYTMTPRLKRYGEVTGAGSTFVEVSGKQMEKMSLVLPSLEEQKQIGRFFRTIDDSITLHQRKLEKLKLNKSALLQKLFPQKGCTIPDVRFKGFTDAWEQRKLSDISTKVTTKNVDVHYMETLTNSAEQGIISQVDFFDKEISNKDNINGYYIVENNDFIYNPRISTLAPVGPINRNKLNRTGIMSPLYTVFRASNVDLGFLEWYFQSSYWHRYMKLNGDSGARADRIAIKDSTFFDMPIKTPVNIKEQVLIGEILEKFNQYITLHQRKLDCLISIKKGLLQQLFV